MIFWKITDIIWKIYMDLNLVIFSSIFWINKIYRHQLTTVTIMDVLEQPGPFYSRIDFSMFKRFAPGGHKCIPIYSVQKDANIF
jgi:hypothetical protein